MINDNEQDVTNANDMPQEPELAPAPLPLSYTPESIYPVDHLQSFLRPSPVAATAKTIKL